jgi:hypothetical protein
MMRTHHEIPGEKKQKAENSTIVCRPHPKSLPWKGKARKSKLSPNPPGPTKKTVVLDPSTVENDIVAIAVIFTHRNLNKMKRDFYLIMKK